MEKRNDVAWHALPVDEALEALGSGIEGLSEEEAAARLVSYGPNELPTEKERSVLILLLKQFHSALIYILIIAAGISFFTGHAFDAAAIGIVVLANGLIGFVQERKAEAALAKLRAMVVPTVSVRRGDRVLRLPAASLVPGDVVIVTQGDRVPADLRLVDARDLSADEAPLTGESVPNTKGLAPVAEAAGVGDRASMVFMGTLISSGEGAGVVTATGLGTVFGAIANSLAVIERERTPLEKRVDQLGRTLAVGAIAFSGLLFGIGLLRGLAPLEMFLTATAMAVSSIPEGLPAVLAIVLAVGVQRMARRNAITRRLPAVETLGTVDVIVTDKTGTLTENQMTARRVFTLTHDVRVTGEGWTPEGEFHSGGERIPLAEHHTLGRLLRIAALCNHAEIVRQDGRWIATGDPTEAALVALAAKGGFEKHDLLRSGRTLDEIPFSSERKYRALLHEYTEPEGEPQAEIMVVGAYETLMNASDRTVEQGNEHDFTPVAAARFEEAVREMGESAMRVLAVAVKRAPGLKELRHEDISGLTLIGLVGMIDPPRRGVAEAISDCRRAGIRVIMNTGDHLVTAVAISREVGILGRDEPAEGRVFTDADAVAMSDAQLKKALSSAVVFARVSPQTKLRVVGALKELGHTVAMTGDGINDAPALKKADIGVAMGITGTDVTKEVAEMVLSDDNFVSIVSAVEEGRIVFRNVKQTVAYLVMTNIGEVATILAALSFGLPLPLLPAQILWLNLVTDGFTGVALAVERRHGDELSRPPRKKSERILSKNLFLMTGLTAALMAAGTLSLFVWADGRDGMAYARSVAFLSMAFFQLWNVFSMRSAIDSVFALRRGANPWVLRAAALSIALIALIMYVPALQQVFGLAALGWKEWALAIAASSSVLWLVEGYKLLIRRRVVPADWL